MIEIRTFVYLYLFNLVIDTKSTFPFVKGYYKLGGKTALKVDFLSPILSFFLLYSFETKFNLASCVKIVGLEGIPFQICSPTKK